LIVVMTVLGRRSSRFERRPDFLSVASTRVPGFGRLHRIA
jgi:hypothetical protein